MLYFHNFEYNPWLITRDGGDVLFQRIKRGRFKWACSGGFYLKHFWLKISYFKLHGNNSGVKGTQSQDSAWEGTPLRIHPLYIPTLKDTYLYDK